MAVKRRGQRRARVQHEHKKEAMLKADSYKAPDETKVKNEKTLVILQEIKIARLLANNDKKIRDRVLKRLKKWLTLRSQSSFEFTDTDFMNLWKGLFYCMWMSDKLLIQEQVAESISNLVHCFKSLDVIVLYTSCALTTLATEWFGLDQYKLDKFSMLVRRILRQTFVVCKNMSWNNECVKKISELIEKLILNPKTSIGFNMHVTDIYLEELAKISGGNLPQNAVHDFIKPFIIYLVTSNTEQHMRYIIRHIFRYLIYQSDVGMDYTEKFEAWRNAGFPCVNVDDMKKVEVSEDDDDEDDDEKLPITEKDLQSKPLDPRAGRVNVDLPQLPFDAAKIAQSLEKYRFHPLSTSKSRRQVLKLIEAFTELAEGRMPLGVKKVRKPSAKKNTEMNSKKAALRLLQFEKELFSDKLSKKQKKNRKHKLIDLDISDKSSLEDSKNEDASDSDVDVDHSKSQDASNLDMDVDHSKSEDASDLDTDVDTIDSENNSIEMAATTKTHMQNLCANVSSKKQKKNISTHDKSVSKRKFVEDKEEKSKTAKKNKMEKIKLEHESDTHVANKKAKHKLKMTSHKQASDNKNQCAFVVPPFFQNQKKKLDNKVKINKPVAKSNQISTSRNNQITPLKTELSNQITKQLDKSSSAKKKVIFGLYRNTTQHTSEYIQQIRKSPAIPFDANKKPLISALKANTLPTPKNPFC